MFQVKHNDTSGYQKKETASKTKQINNNTTGFRYSGSSVVFICIFRLFQRKKYPHYYH